MPFEQFVEKDAILRYYKGMRVPMASIFVNQVLAFNKCATQDFLTEEDKFVNIFYDKETNRIGLRLLKEEEPNSYKLRRNYTKHFVGVHVKGFLNSIGIRPKKPLNFKLEKDVENGLLVFSLASPLRKIKSATMKAKYTHSKKES